MQKELLYKKEIVKQVWIKSHEQDRNTALSLMSRCDTFMSLFPFS